MVLKYPQIQPLNFTTMTTNILNNHSAITTFKQNLNNKLWDLNLPDLLSDLLETDVMDFEFQKTLKNYLTNKDMSNNISFSTFDLVKVNTKFNLAHYGVENQFSIHTTTSYAGELASRYREASSFVLCKRQLNRAPSLSMIYETSLPFYNMSHIFKNYVAYTFRISARPCSSASLIIHTDTYFCKDDILLDPVPPRYRGKNLIENYNEINYPAPISPTRNFVLQAGLISAFSKTAEMELIDTLKDLASNFSMDFGSVAGSTNAGITSIVEMLSNLTKDKSTAVQEFAEKHIADFKEQVSPDNVMKGLCKNISIIALVASGAHALLVRSKESYYVFGASVIAAAWFNKEAIFEFLTLWFKHKDNVAQAGLVTDDYFSGAIVFLSGLMFTQTAATKMPKEILQSLGNFARYKSSLKDLFDCFMRVIDTLLKHVGLADGLPSWMKFANQNEESITQFLESMDSLILKIKNKTFIMSDNTWTEVQELIIRSRRIALGLKNATPATTQLLAQQVRYLENLRQKFIDANYSYDGLRVHPISVVFAGDPGTGKSNTMEWLTDWINARTLTGSRLTDFSSNRSKYYYTRCAETVYWDGYSPNANVCQFDDIFQIKEIAGNADAEPMNFIRCVDERPYILHCADISDKGNTYFRSPFVFATTNMVQAKFESIYDSRAVTRRYKFFYKVVPKEEFGIIKDGVLVLDVEKLPKPDGITTALDPSQVCEYIALDPKTGKPVTPNIRRSFLEVAELIYEAHVESKARFQSKMEGLAQQTAEVIKMYQPDMYDEIYIRDDESDQFVECPDMLRVPDQVLFKGTKDLTSQEIIDMLSVFDDKVASYKAQGGLSEEPESYDENITFEDLFPFESNYESDPEFIAFSNKIKYLDSFEKSNIVDNCERVRHQLIESYAPCLGMTIETLAYTMWKTEPRYFSIFAIKLNISYANYVASMLALNLPCPDIKEESWFTTYFQTFKTLFKFTAARIYTKFGETMRTSLNWLQANKTIVFALLGIGTILKGFMSWNSNDTEPFENQSLPLKSGSKGNLKEFVSRAKANNAQMALGSDKNGTDLVNKYLKSHCYEILIEENLIDDKKKPYINVASIGFLTFIVNRLALMQSHFLISIQDKLAEGQLTEESKVTIRLNKSSTDRDITYHFTLIEFIAFANFDDNSLAKDLCLMEFPMRVHQHADIRRLIPPAKEIGKVKEYPMRLICPRKGDKETAYAKATVRNNLPYTAFAGGPLSILRTGYAYDIKTSSGDCGGWVTLQVPHFKYKLIGFHMAGDSVSSGFATAICLEDINDLVGLLEPIASAPMEMPEEDQVIDTVVGQGQFTELYKVDKVPFNVAKSSIIKSKLYGKWMKPLTKQAILKIVKVDGVLVNPLFKALTKYCLPNVLIDKNVVHMASDMYFDTLKRCKVYVIPEVFSFEEAIIGLAEDSEFGSIARGTSAGYPLNVQGHRKKYTLWGEDGDYTLDSVENLKLKSRVLESIEKAKRGIRTHYIFYDNLKDERRPLEKVAEVSTRMFSAAPADLSVITRMYFGAFTLFFNKNRISNGSAVGVNPYSLEWHDIATRLLNFGSPQDECIGAGDFSRYDGSQKGDIHWLILDIINKWYNDGPENAQIRTILWHEVTNSNHLIEDIVVNWPNSLPSGHPLTILVNTMYNNIAFRCCWIRATENTDFSPSDFEKYIFLIAAGDDNLFSVHPEVRDIFNEVTLSGFMKEFGLTYTNETKTQSIELLRKIDSVEFLKRGFSYSQELARYIAPLRLSVVLEIPMWTKVKESAIIVEDNVDQSLRELSFHGREIFEKYEPLISQALKDEYNEWPKTTSYRINLHNVINCKDYY